MADVTGALFIATLICTTMLPLSIYTAKILLQVCNRSTLTLRSTISAGIIDLLAILIIDNSISVCECRWLPNTFCHYWTNLYER